jgi:nucleoside-diphosphate-sugar epimerase
VNAIHRDAVCRTDTRRISREAVITDAGDVGLQGVGPSFSLVGKALVTGAAGFTGGHLVRALQERGVRVRALVHNSGKAQFRDDVGLEVVNGDLTRPLDIERAISGCDFVFHLAAIHRDGKSGKAAYWRVNVDGTRHVAEAAARAGVRRFVHCSTAALHDSTVVPADESVAVVAEDIYESSKLVAEERVSEQLARGLAGTIVRPVGIYGPGEMRFLKLFRSVKNGTFRMIGTGETLQHLTFVDDVVEGMLLAAASPTAVGQSYILAGPRYTDLNELVRTTARVLGVAVPKGSIPAGPVMAVARIAESVCQPLGIHPPLYPRRVAFFTRHRAFSSQKARRELGYEPRVHLEEGLRRMAAWYREIGAL